MPWLNVYQFVDEPPNIQKPPDGWKEKYYKSGAEVPFIAYEVFESEFDWLTGKPSEEKKLVWKRAYFWLPTQQFEMMQLQTDNTWRHIALIQGPREYLALDAEDGYKHVFKLRAV